MNCKTSVILVGIISLLTFASSVCLVSAQPVPAYPWFGVGAYCTDIVHDEIAHVFSYTAADPGMFINIITLWLSEGADPVQYWPSPGDRVVIDYVAHPLTNWTVIEDPNNLGHYNVASGGPLNYVTINGASVSGGLHGEKGVSIMTNSTITNLVVDEVVGRISFNASGPDGSLGYCNITIPHSVIAPPFEVEIDGQPKNFETLWNNGTHSNIYLEYQHSTHEIVIIPELPSLLILSLFMVVPLLATVLHRRRLNISK